MELGLCLNRGLLQANVLFRLGAILLFPSLRKSLEKLFNLAFKKDPPHPREDTLLIDGPANTCT
jgi:hypothetical protein